MIIDVYKTVHRRLQELATYDGYDEHIRSHYGDLLSEIQIHIDHMLYMKDVFEGKIIPEEWDFNLGLPSQQLSTVIRNVWVITGLSSQMGHDFLIEADTDFYNDIEIIWHQILNLERGDEEHNLAIRDRLFGLAQKRTFVHSQGLTMHLRIFQLFRYGLTDETVNEILQSLQTQEFDSQEAIKVSQSV